jgi:peptide/nickel transport system ATP-binding protein
MSHPQAGKHNGSIGESTGTIQQEPLLDVENLQVHFPLKGGGLFSRSNLTLKAVDGVSFTIYRGETLGLVGESGCGKTTAGRSILRAIEPTGGKLVYHRADGTTTELTTLNDRQLKPMWKEIRMVFQDPFSSLNPRMTVKHAVSEPMMNFNMGPGPVLERRVAELLQRVGLRPEYMQRYPHAFSGGERQRISIARALALDPRLVVLDEAVSALDVSVRAQILNLLKDLQLEFDLTYLFISHDLSVVQHICDRVAVMYVGKIVELSPSDQLFRRPLHPYTETLLSAVPVPDPRLRNRRRRIRPRGEVADPVNPPSGCYFHPRCQYAQERCKIEPPPLREIVPGRFAACHFSEDLQLVGLDQLSNPARFEKTSPNDPD